MIFGAEVSVDYQANLVKMARLERFELPTNWFEVLKVKL